MRNELDWDLFRGLLRFSQEPLLPYSGPTQHTLRGLWFTGASLYVTLCRLLSCLAK